MPAHHAKTRLLVVANARHSPSYGCALRLIWSRLSIKLGIRWSSKVDQVMRVGRSCDDESDSYPRIGYQHDIDSSWTFLALDSRIFRVLPANLHEMTS
jgi:hypothetical protein